MKTGKWVRQVASKCGLGRAWKLESIWQSRTLWCDTSASIFWTGCLELWCSDPMRTDWPADSFFSFMWYAYTYCSLYAICMNMIYFFSYIIQYQYTLTCHEMEKKSSKYITPECEIFNVKWKTERTSLRDALPLIRAGPFVAFFRVTPYDRNRGVLTLSCIIRFVVTSKSQERLQSSHSGANDLKNTQGNNEKKRKVVHVYMYI